MTETLADRAKRNASEREGGEWGYRVALEVGETFEGRYRGTELATGGDYGDQTLYLFWDRDGAACYMRGHASLVRKVESAEPGVGDDVAVFRADDYQSAGGTGYTYGIAAEPSDAPIPESPDFDVDEPAAAATPAPAEPTQATLDDDEDW